MTTLFYMLAGLVIVFGAIMAAFIFLYICMSGWDWAVERKFNRPAWRYRYYNSETRTFQDKPCWNRLGQVFDWETEFPELRSK